MPQPDPLMPAIAGRRVLAPSQALVRTEPMVAGFLGRDRLAPMLPVVALVIAAGLLFGGFNDAQGQAVSCILNAGLLGMLLLERPPTIGQWRRIIPVLAPIGAAPCWVALAGVWSTPLAPDLFAAQLLSYLAGVAALLAGWMIGMRHGVAGRAIGWLVAWSCAAIVIGLVLRQAGLRDMVDGIALEREDRFQGLVGNVNVAAASAGVTAMLAAGRLATIVGAGPLRERPGRIAAAGACVAAVLVALVALVATASRFGVVASLCLAALIGIAGRRRAALSRPMAISLAIVVLAAILAASSALLTYRLGFLGDDMDLRLAIWAHALDVAAAAPFSGYGFGAFPSINAIFLVDPALAERSWTANSAHDVLLQVLLVGGIPYLALLLAAAWIGTRQVLAGMRGGWTADMAGVAAAVLVVVSMGAVDIALDVPATTTLALFLAGLLWGVAVTRMAAGYGSGRGSWSTIRRARH